MGHSGFDLHRTSTRPGTLRPPARRRRPGPVLVAAALPLLIAADPPAVGDERRFTFVYEATTLPRGSAEYEQWVTWKTHKGTDSDFDRIDFRHELEFGLTDRLQLALYVSDWRYQDGATVDDGAEWRNAAVEVIYRLTDPVTDPVGLALYGEVKLGDELLELEGKLIAQKDIGKWVVAWNGTIEAEWEGSDFDQDKGKLEQSLGASYQFSPGLLGGFELLHEVEYEDWSRWGDHVLYLGPNLSYRPGQWWATITPLAQVTDVDSEPDFQIRVIFGIDF